MEGNPGCVGRRDEEAAHQRVLGEALSRERFQVTTVIAVNRHEHPTIQVSRASKNGGRLAAERTRNGRCFRHGYFGGSVPMRPKIRTCGLEASKRKLGLPASDTRRRRKALSFWAESSNL